MENMGMDLSVYHNDKMQQYLPILIDSAKKLKSLTYDSKCMFINALYQYIVSLCVFERGYYDEDDYDFSDIEEYVESEHKAAFSAFKVLVEIKDYVCISCYVTIARKAIENFINSDDLMSILTEFGIVTTSDLNNAFRASTIMGGE